MTTTRVLGIVGWSGSGKTTLITRLIPVLIERALRIATIKHAHHAFDIDQPGKDSFEHRRAGASEVIVSSSKRWAQIHENGGREATLDDLLRRLAPCDLVLVEGFKNDKHSRIEVYRTGIGEGLLYPQDDGIVAVVTDGLFRASTIPVVDLNDIQAVADCVLRFAMPLHQVLAQSMRDTVSIYPAVDRGRHEF